MFRNAEQVLEKEYGIQVLGFLELPSGWSAAAWKVYSNQGDYFLKVYDKHKPSTKGWVARIDTYMPVTLWLYENTMLRERMTAPLLTKNGSYKWENADMLYMVFPFIEGHTIGEDKLNLQQIREIAQIAAQLHLYGAEIPVPTDSLRETFDVSFCGELSSWLRNKQESQIKVSLTPYSDTILRAVLILQNTADALRKSDIRFALCHTDIHGWNLMQSKNLVLIDWEGLKLAPVEADLFAFSESFFFDYAWDTFLSVYSPIRKDYRINPEAMRFYRLRRRLEDIYEFTKSILYDDLSQEDLDRSLYYQNQECVQLKSNIDSIR